MGSVDPSIVGGWADRPRRRPDVRLSEVDLDNREAFVFTRIDGVATIGDLCEMCGLGEDDTYNVLGRLLGLGLIDVERVEVEEAPEVEEPAAAEPELGASEEEVERAQRMNELRRRREARGGPKRRAPAARPRGPRVTKRLAAPEFELDPYDSRVLARQGRNGLVPPDWLYQPGDRRYGDFVFDRALMTEKVALEFDQKREILFIEAHLDRIGHFELLGARPTDDRKQLKKAFFAFSKKFHPDNFYGKDLGSYAERVQRIFKHGNDVFNLLYEDEGLRTAYFNAIQTREQARQDAADQLKQALEDRKKELEARRMADADARAEGRKERLRAKLESRTRSRIERSRATNNPMMERVRRAEQYYREGMAHYENESFVQAANSLKLACTFDPNNKTYADAFARVRERASSTIAENHWKRGILQESLGRTREALEAFVAAVEVHERPDYLTHTASLLATETDDLHRAAELAHKATVMEPQNVDSLLLLGQIYARAKLHKKAIAVYEKVLSIDAKHEHAKKAIKALKRM
jgi:tetratricopeptide (TPR) repeat protein